MNKKMFSLIFLLIIIICSLYIFNRYNPYYHRYKSRKELYNVHSIIDINDKSFKSMELLESDLNNNKIFFAGEAHGSIKSIELNLYLIKYFTEKAMVKYILYEGGYSTAQYLNIYLNTGDEDIIKYLIDSQRKSANYTIENYNFLREVYNYNLTLPKDKKIKFVGIDTENYNIAIRYLNYLLGNKKENTNSIIVNEFIRIIKHLTRYNYIEDSKKAIELINTDKEEIANYLGIDFFDVEYILKNLSISNGQVIRENILIDNFKTLYKHLPTGKYFGQFGSSHTNLHSNTGSLASYLNKEYSDTKNKVISIEYIYNNSFCYIPYGLETNSKINQVLDEYLFNKDDSFILFKLNYEDSIYEYKNIFLTNGDAQIDYYQYLILINNSLSANKYDPDFFK